MKPFKIIMACTLLCVIAACEPPLIFTEPQPAGTDSLLKFPGRLQGSYLSQEDGSVVLISDELILKTYDVNEKVHLNQLDSTELLSGDTLIHTKTKEKELIQREGDSLVIHIHYADTLFHIGDEQVLRKLKGYYFLNKRYNGQSWEVKKVQLTKGILTIGSTTSSDLEDLKEVTETPADTIAPYTATISKHQFKKFVRHGGFGDTETFVKQKSR